MKKIQFISKHKCKNNKFFIFLIVFTLIISVVNCIYAQDGCEDCYPMKSDIEKKVVDPECEEFGKLFEALAKVLGKAVAIQKIQDQYGVLLEVDEAILSGHFNYCGMKYDPPDLEKSKALSTASGPTLINPISGGCPCIGGVTVETNGCHIIFKCNMGGDQNASIEITTPCPTVRGSDPKYPLVKMLSGTLIEWNNEPTIKDGTGGYLSRGAPGGTGERGAFYGAEAFEGLHVSYVVSSVDIGKNIQFSIEKANAKKNSKSPLDRKNIDYWLIGENPYVEVLSQKDIYNAYKEKSKYVQAYLVLANKGFGERPWTNYDKFVDAMCNMSENKSRCKKQLAYNAHKDTELKGNMYMGNANASIIGLYSEISSHGCHGATAINDDGQPAFAIKIESTWCFYIRAMWANYATWELDKMEKLDRCCEGVKSVPAGKQDVCPPPGMGECVEVTIYKLVCSSWHEYWLIEESWHSHGGGSSSGDCGVCHTATGYVDAKGNMIKDPLGISFYQSQPLLIKGN